MAKKHKNIYNSNNMPSRSKTVVAPIEAAFSNDLPHKPTLLKLNNLEELAEVYVNEEDWDELVSLGDTPVSNIVEEEREWAAIWLLRIQVLGYTHCERLRWHQIKGETLEKLNEALTALAGKLQQFHRAPEFDPYLSMVGGYPCLSLESAVQAFKKLQEGFLDVPQPHWLPVVRSLGMRLMSPEQFNDIELSNIQRVLLESLGDIGLAVSEIYDRAGDCEGWSQKDRLIVKVLQIDLNAQLAEPWDYEQISNAILRLPQPDLAELAKRKDGSALQHFTPAGWAFLWDLGHSSAKDWASLLVKHTGPFGCDACKGLKLIVQSLNAESTLADKFLSEAVQALIQHFIETGGYLGHGLTVTLPDGVCELPDCREKLTFQDIGELLLRLVEHVPHSYNRTAELTTFYRIFGAVEHGVKLDDEGEIDNGLPGLEWLCKQSLLFHLSAACSMAGLTDRMVLLLQGLCRCAQEGHPAKGSYYYWGNLKEGELQPEQAGIVLDQLAQLVPLRARLDEHSESIWSDVVSDIFAALSRKGLPLDRTLVLAREFSEDLLGADQEFRLAYLEQLAGSADMALYYYLQYLEGEGQARTTALTNIKLLWSGNDDFEQVQNLVEQLESAVAASPHQEELRQLLADAQARLKILAKEQQFEKTAVNRWPDISIQARKLLGVLHVIDHYSSFEELGGYASMDAIWAKRHYNKLVETGMLLVANSKFRVNPFIEPLLEREAQHAVVGRIIRAQGTSAVKQVFNSQREFLIYQIMVQLCPNHLVFPNSSLQSIMSYDRMKELVNDDDFGYYLRASVDLVLISSTTYLPWLAIEVDSIWHDTERQQKNDGKKDRLFAAAGVPFMRLQPVGNPSESTIRGQVAQHLDELVRTLRTDLPGYEQARRLLENLSGADTDLEKAA